MFRFLYFNVAYLLSVCPTIFLLPFSLDVGTNQSSSSSSSLSSNNKTNSAGTPTTGNRRNRGRTNVSSDNVKEEILPVDEDIFTHHRNNKNKLNTDGGKEGGQKTKKTKTRDDKEDDDIFDENIDIIQAARKHGMTVTEYATWRTNKQLDHQYKDINTIVEYIRNHDSNVRKKQKEKELTHHHEGFHGISEDEIEIHDNAENEDGDNLLSPSEILKRMGGGVLIKKKKRDRQTTAAEDEDNLQSRNPAYQEYSNIQYKMQQRTKEVLDRIDKARSGAIDPGIVNSLHHRSTSNDPSSSSSSMNEITNGKKTAGQRSKTASSSGTTLSSSSSTGDNPPQPSTKNEEKFAVIFNGAENKELPSQQFSIRLSTKFQKVLPTLKTVWKNLPEDIFSSLTFEVNGVKVNLDDTFGDIKYYDPEVVDYEVDEGHLPIIYCVDCKVSSAANKK